MKFPTRRILLMVLLISAFLAGTYFAFVQWDSHRGLPDGLIQTNGRIEGDAVTVASKVAGRIVGIEVREGQTIKAGQLLVRLDDAQLRARVDQAAAVTATLESQVASARLGIDLLRKEVPLAVEAARAGVAGAQAVFAQAEATERQARRDADRLHDLVAKGFASSQQGERAQLALDAAASESTSAREALVQNRKHQKGGVESCWPPGFPACRV